MMRTADQYNYIVEQLATRYGLFADQGLESHLFTVDEEILKIYQWFLLNDLSPEQELRLWQRQALLLSIYAPALHARILPVSSQGMIGESITEVFCYGLLMTRGEPITGSLWDQSSTTGRLHLAGHIGETLAARHLAAPQQEAAFFANSGVLIIWIEAVLQIIDFYTRNEVGLPNVRPEIIHAVERMIDAGVIARPARVPLIHGDLNLSNIVLYRNQMQSEMQSEMQFIDPGPAILLGIGIAEPEQWTLDVWWDVIALANALQRRGERQAETAFLHAYAIRSGLDNEYMRIWMRYWEALFDLTIVAICLKRWQDFQSEANPFARYLRSSGISLQTYIHGYFARCLHLLNIHEPDTH